MGAEANRASIIFDENFDGDNFEEARDITRESTNCLLSKGEKNKGVERREGGITKDKNRWRVQERVHSKRAHIGNYSTLAEANRASIIFDEEIFNGHSFKKSKE